MAANPTPVVAQPGATPAVPPVPKAHPTASLYVGDLDPEVTEGMLYEVFSTVGPVAFIRVCRDATTRRSLGYAYVNYHDAEDAERALDAMNNTLIHGRICRIMWSQRDPTVRKSGVGNIFIKDLDPSITHQELYDTFSVFGNILSCKVMLDHNGESRGFGFVHFEKEESAKKAIEMVNGKQIGEKKVFVGPFLPQRERLEMKERSWTNVFVKNLDAKVSDDELRKEFEEFGEITSCVVMKDEAGNSRGFGFINYTNHDDAVKAVEAMNGKKLGDSEIYAGRAQKKHERASELQKKHELTKQERMKQYSHINLYVKHLDDEIDEERLKKEFSQFGPIKSCKILRDEEKGVSKGVGFVCFTTPEDAQRAIQEMNGRLLPGCTKPLYVQLHEPKEVRRQRLAQRHAVRKQLRPGQVAPNAAMFQGGMFYGGNQPYMYPPQTMLPRRWGQGPQPGYQIPPNYMVAPVRGGGPPQRGGRGQSVAGGRGGRSGRRPQTGGQPMISQPGGAPPTPMGMVQPVIANLTVEQLNQLPPDQQKVYVGEKLYPLIHKLQPQLAGKITGMLLDSGWSMGELFSLAENVDALSAKVDEALAALERARVAATSTATPAENTGETAPNGEAGFQATVASASE